MQGATLAFALSPQPDIVPHVFFCYLYSLKKYLPLLLAALALLSVPVPAAPGEEKSNNASLVVEYGLDSLERRYYHPSFRFDFPFRKGYWFAEVQYHSRMNGRLQGAIDYWVNVGAQKALNEKLALELRLNHFCRHEVMRAAPYVWNLNEVLGKVSLAGENFSLVLGGGGFIGGSEGYRGLVTANGSWQGFLIPELALFAEVKLVNFSRIYHDVGFAVALSPSIDFFFKNTHHYEFPNTSYLGLRLHSGNGSRDGAFLDYVKALAGVSPFDDRFKLEIEGAFGLEFFRNDSRRVALGIVFETPVLNGDSFFSQFWPLRMSYAIGLDYEKKLAPRLFAAWVARYNLTVLVDRDRPFTASLFTGLALRNQPDFDELGQDVRYEVMAGYNFKRGLELDGRLGLGIWGNGSLKVFTEMKGQVDDQRIRLDLRLMASAGNRVEFRPYVGWKKDIGFQQPSAGQDKLLFGLGFFKKF